MKLQTGQISQCYRPSTKHSPTAILDLQLTFIYVVTPSKRVLSIHRSKYYRTALCLCLSPFSNKLFDSEIYLLLRHNNMLTTAVCFGNYIILLLWYSGRTSYDVPISKQTRLLMYKHYSELFVIRLS